MTTPGLCYLVIVKLVHLLFVAWQRFCSNVLRKEGNVLFNDAFNTFYLRLYGVTHMVKNHSDTERGKLNVKGRFLAHTVYKGQAYYFRVFVVAGNQVNNLLGRSVSQGMGLVKRIEEIK